MLTVELAAKISALALATGYKVTRGKMPPSTPDKVIAIFETGGAGPSLTFDGQTVENPAVQFAVRGAPNDYDGPRATIGDLYDAVASWGAFTQSGTRYLNVTPLNSPFVKDRDGNQRVEFAFNAIVEKELS